MTFDSMRRRDFLKASGLLAVASPSLSAALESPLALAKEAFEQAKIVWNMNSLDATGTHPLSLAVKGAKTIQWAQKLNGAEYEESIKRGGDGRVVAFDNPPMSNMFDNSHQGWLSIDVEQAQTLRPVGSAASLYVRAFFEKPDGWGTLFFSDWLGLAVHESGLAIAFLGQKTTEGVIFREIPLAVIQRGVWLDLIIRIGNRRLEFFCNGALKRSISLTKELGVPFQGPLLVGGFGSPPGAPYLLKTKIDTIALWDQAIAESRVAFLSGIDGLKPQVEEAPASQAIAAYNRFYDASESKDLDLCRRLGISMREFMKRDPTRPIYHLTAPIGFIYDPTGAFQFQGKYHIFSYHNVYTRLKFCSHDHYVSDDLVHWHMWPMGPLADSKDDVYGIYLANFIIDKEGLPNMIYGGNAADGEHGIRARSRDGMISFTDKKVVIPEYHDGHAWKEGDTWYAITMRWKKVVNDPEIVIYSSTDLDQWTERGVLFSRPKQENAEHWADKMGYMEFPYLFSAGKKDVLMAGYSSTGTRYWVGHFDRQAFKFIPDDPEGLRIDYANPFHCFNPSTVDAKGPGGTQRRIIMAMEPRPRGAASGLPWSGVHAMPRLLTVEDDHLRQDPLPEMAMLRGAHQSFQNIDVAPDRSGYVKAKGDALEIVAEFENRGASLFGLKVRLSKDGKTFVRVFFDTKTNEYGVDGNLFARSLHDEPWLNPKRGVGPSYLQIGKPVVMRIFLDKILIEAFVNGQTCTTSLEDVNPLNDGMDLFSEGGMVVCRKLDIWEMKSSF